MSLEPPPRIVDKFVNIWRDWLFFFWEFVDSHTGGSAPTPPATGTSWNAHGNTATGNNNAAESNLDASGNEAALVIDKGSFLVGNTDGNEVGNTVDINQAGTYMAWMPLVTTSNGYAFRMGTTSFAGATIWSDANLGGNTIAMGTNANCSGGESIAIGNSALSYSSSGLAIGAECEAGVSSGFAGIGNAAIGFNAVASGIGSVSVGRDLDAGSLFGDSVAIGKNLTVTGASAITVGIGASSSDRFTNSVADSMMLGANIGAADTATLTLIANKCGVLRNDPLSTLDIGGSVGFKYTNIDAAAGGSTTIASTDNEYTFTIDIEGFTAGQQYTINLPQISGVDRRVYYFKVISTGAAPPFGGGTTGLVLHPFSGDNIESLSGGGGSGLGTTADIVINLGDAVTLSANNGVSTWWII